MKRPIRQVDILTAVLVCVLYVFFSFQAPPFFESMERFVYGVAMRLDTPPSTGENRIAIVNIDEKSLEQLGPWPWPRRLIAEMVHILQSNGAALIGVDLLFRSKEHNQGLEELRDLYERINRRRALEADPDAYVWILERLQEILEHLDNDKRLIQAVKESGNVFLPVVGKFGSYDTELIIPSDSFLRRNIFRPLRFDKDLEEVLSVNRIATPFQALAESSRGLGHINLSANEVVRGQVHLPFLYYRGNLIPSMSLRLALEYRKKAPRQVVVLNDRIQLDGEIIPAYNGEVFIKFKGGRRSFPYYSFVDILRVKKVPAVFDEKIVLIGRTAGGENEGVDTPVDPLMPRVELTANIIEDLMDGRYLKRPESLVWVEAALVLVAGLLALLFLPAVPLARRSALLGLFIFTLFITSMILFIGMGTWFKITYIGLTPITLYIIFAVRDFVLRERFMERTSKETIETNRMLGLSFQSQGLLDLAFEKFRKCPLDDSMKDVLYNLGLDFERKRMLNKAVSVYEYIGKTDEDFRDLKERIPKLRRMAGEFPIGRVSGKQEEKIVVSDDLGTKPTVGRYEILGELGQGAMGMVYKARDPRINRLLAIKTIRFSDEFEEDKIREVKERFFKEAELAGKLSHPSIIAIYDVGEDYDLTYMAMELLEGKDLEHFWQKDTMLPLRKVIQVVAETAEALDYAHRQGVIHRDVKPGNIMLLKNGGIKVTDFGIAKAVSSSQTRTGVILGTPNYMSPEQITGGEIDGRTDIFSLGVVFFQLVTGELPFRGKTLTELFYQITQGRHPDPSTLNPRVVKPCVQLIDKALAKDPNDRFQSAGEFAKYLKRLLRKMDQLARGR
ncbi:MAG: hypothetical protein DRH20_13175 [Deltaproteobacteria bacterium]|nr:MAG: hypothetical protein DRH20_13175 [Deltaproteobacteria bacterium]